MSGEGFRSVRHPRAGGKREMRRGIEGESYIGWRRGERESRSERASHFLKFSHTFSSSNEARCPLCWIILEHSLVIFSYFSGSPVHVLWLGESLGVAGPRLHAWSCK
jgi:hypothetical protein